MIYELCASCCLGNIRLRPLCSGAQHKPFGIETKQLTVCFSENSDLEGMLQHVLNYRMIGSLVYALDHRDCCNIKQKRTTPTSMTLSQGSHQPLHVK